MTQHTIFIDGQAGTTGIQIADRLKHHEAVRLIEIDPADRKNAAAKEKIMREADLAFLCLPDAAAIDAAAMARANGCKVVDASTAHRVADGWVYGLAELAPGQREAIAAADAVSNPGCYPTGALVLLKPLVADGALPTDAQVNVTGYSGYSGGGKQMIADYEQADDPSGCALYGLDFNHKHLPEMQKWSGLTRRPIFTPCVVDTRQGMLVTIALHGAALTRPVSALADIYADYYRDETFVTFDETSRSFSERFKFIEGLADTNRCEVSVFADPDHDQVLLVAKLDNLGKGASGAAVQNMNIMLGLPEGIGVDLA